MDGAAWVVIVRRKQVVYNNKSSHTEQPSQLTATAIVSAEPHPSSLHPPSAVPPSTALTKRVSSSVPCVCLPPSDLRLQRTRTPRRARRPSFGLSRLVSLSLTLFLPPASPLLLCSTQRGTVCCCTVSLVLLLLSSCPRLAPPDTPTHTRHDTRGSYGTQRARKQASSTYPHTRLHQ